MSEIKQDNATEMSMTHVAIVIEPERMEEAEAFYRRLFGMEVAFRETRTTEGWATLPSDVDVWYYTRERNINIGLIMLYRGGLSIDLEARTVPQGSGRFSHTGLHVAGDELALIKNRVRDLDCAKTFDAAHMIVFDDPFRMRWEVTTLSYEKPSALSAGCREGRWYATQAA
jgi:catechol 2,3-dioxygenase-like lactoylglutathione lyase family enzyme